MAGQHMVEKTISFRKAKPNTSALLLNDVEIIHSINNKVIK